MMHKQFVLIGCLALCLALSTACATIQNDRISASPDRMVQSVTENIVPGHTETPTPTLTPIPPTATSTPTPPSATSVPTDTAAPTPSPTETPMPQLSPYSTDVTFPFALGNTWVYSGTIYAGFNPTEVFTATYVVTESVAALHSHPPYTVVQIHREQVPSPIPAEDDYWSAEKLTATEYYWYAIKDRTVYRLREEPDWDAMATSVATGTTEIGFVFPLEVGQRWYLNEKMQELYPDYEVDSMLRKVVQQGAIETSTETFEKCFQMTEIVGGYTFEMWFCPGVGIVARKADHSGTPMGMRELLMRYSVLPEGCAG
jgi:hypothetical protein